KAARAAPQDRGAAVAQAGDVRVPYIPQTVRDQIRDEVKAEVMVQAKEENWAQPNTFPDWVSRITIFFDVRVRDESRLYSRRYIHVIVDFAKLNAKGPYDLNRNTNGNYPPMLNTRED
ncbi:putative porin, partial [Achromobacter xylosoxidans]